MSIAAQEFTSIPVNFHIRFLTTAHRKMYKASNGARMRENNMLFLFTDGHQTQRKGARDPSVLAERLRRQGVNIIVIAIRKKRHSQVSCLIQIQIEVYIQCQIKIK